MQTVTNQVEASKPAIIVLHPRDYGEALREQSARELAKTMTIAGLRRFQALADKWIGKFYRTDDGLCRDWQACRDIYTRAVDLKAFGGKGAV